MKNTLLRYNRIGSLIICIGLLFPPIIRAHNPTQQELDMLQQLLSQAAAEQKAHNRRLASTLLESKPSVFDQFGKKSIISANEIQELQLKDLVTVCIKPETAFGYKGAEWLLIPVTDHTEILRRQTIVKAFKDDEKLAADVQKALQNIASSEHAVLMYWDKQSELMQKFSQFFWTFMGIKEIAKPANKSPLSLNLGSALSIFNHTNEFLVHICLAGALQAFMLSPKKFKFKDVFMSSIRGPKSMLNPAHEYLGAESLDEDGNKVINAVIREENGQKTWVWQDWVAAHLMGSAGDRYTATKQTWQHLGEQVGGEPVGNVVGNTLGRAHGFSWAVGAGLLYFIAWGFALKLSIEKVRDYWKDVFQLRDSLKDLATFIRALESFEQSIGSHSALATAKSKQYLHQTMNKKNWSADLKKLNDILDSSMFNKDSKLFLPGQLFAAHSLMQQVKGELVPAMQAVAEFDAYLSLAKLCKEHEGQENGFTFVEFIPQDTPFIEIDQVWTPFVGAHKAVSNPIKIGVDGKPIRMVITGPNGGGKSIYFTALGQAVVMAHSWGIVPGNRARMTFFNQIRTSFAPQEDKLHGISKFMAQKRHIASISRLIKTSNADNKMLVLLDEPYDGTTEHLMAERVFDFGTMVKQLPHVVIGIATHVQKPIELAYDGSFINYHVGIAEPKRGMFERTFKLEEGPAHWWFNDKEQGGRYQDWLDVYMQRSALVTV